MMPLRRIKHGPMVSVALMAVALVAFAQIRAQEHGPRLEPPSGFERPAPPTPPPVVAPPAVPASTKGEAPKVIIETIGPGSLNIGRPLDVEIVLKNVGTAAAAQVRIEHVLPRQAKFIKGDPEPTVEEDRLVWRLDSLPAGTEHRFKIELQPQEEVEITGKATVTYSTATGWATRITRPQLAVKKTGPERAVIGDSFPFKIDVSNPGTGPATNVVIRDQLPAGLQHSQGDYIEADIGTLAPGETRSINLTVKAVKPGQHINEVVATGDDNLRALASASVYVGQPALELTKKGPTQRLLNTETIFVLEVTNPGDAPARKVQLHDALPAGLRFVAASDGGQYDKESHSVHWMFETLEPGDKRRVTLKAITAAIGELKNQAVARAEPGLNAKTQATLRVEGVPAMMLEVVDLDDPLEVGAETCYEVRVVNQGTAVQTNVQLVALVPEGMTALRADVNVPYRVQGRQVIFDTVPRLGPKADIIYRIFVRGDETGDHRFKVQLHSDQLRIPVSEEESTKVYQDNGSP